jgi:anaerobic ribonucleoside-triphosphate reductase activating protein
LRYAGIINEDFGNGKGVGVSLFVQGCHWHCKGCFNEETWDFNQGKAFTHETVDEILADLSKPYITRFTVLGGEPLDNCFGVLQVLKNVKQKFPEINIWLYTGYTWEQIYGEEGSPLMRKIVRYVDILVDGRFILEEKNLALPFRGSDNQRIIDVQKSLKGSGATLYNV